MDWSILANSRKSSPSKANFPDARLAEADALPRRAMLRGALAAECSLLLPTVLMGCDSRKQAGTTDNAPPAPGPETARPAPDLEPAAPAGPAKVSQENVQYQTQPKGEQKCANCIHFIAESNACKLVEGEISPEGWCTIWTGQT